MCHQSIFSFTKCQHTAHALTICAEGTFAPLKPCLEDLDGDFIQFDAICKGCQAVLHHQGAPKDSWRLPADVKGIYDTMPFGYVIGGQLPWTQPWYDTKKPPKATLVVCSERDSWRIWEESLVSVVLSTRDGDDDDNDDDDDHDTHYDDAYAYQTAMREFPNRKDSLTPSLSSPSTVSAPGFPSSAASCPRQKPSCCRANRLQRGCSPPTCEATRKSSIKRPEDHLLSPSAVDHHAHSQFRPKPRVRFLPNAEVQYFIEDTATNLLKKGDTTTMRDTIFVT